MIRLSQYIRENIEQIVSEWEAFAHSLPPASNGKMSRLVLQDHAREILKFIANDIDTFQSSQEQHVKSHGKTIKKLSSPDTAAEVHGALRLENGFDTMQMVSEYRALRASVVRLWLGDVRQLDKEQLEDLIRFNEAIDQALAESTLRFTKNLDKSKDLFIGILGHDIRNPLGAVGTLTRLFKKTPLNQVQTEITTHIEECIARINNIVTNLSDLTRARLTGGLPIIKEPLNFADISQQIVKEMQVLHLAKNILINIVGNVDGQGDPARIKQVLSNLLGNAIQYAKENTPITINVEGKAKNICLSVHNKGTSIPASAIPTIFDALVRGGEEDIEQHRESMNLGLGLYISKMIVLAHEGELSVTSTEAEGTTFTACFPKK